MARALVVTSSPLFVEGGHLVIARALVQAFRDAGHEADLLITPQNRFGRQGSAYLATWLTDVSHDQAGQPVDAVVSMRYPSYAVRHPRHACWLNHTMREYYDLWPRFSAGLSRKARLKESVRRSAMHAADRYLLRRNVTRMFAQSQTIRRRLADELDVLSEVLYPPAPQRPYRCESFDPYVFAVSRLTPLKRLDLLLDALALPDANGARCVIAGEGEEQEFLLDKIRTLSLESRVTLIGRIDDATLVEHLARCRAVCFIPKAEDYGLVTAEGFASGKPVITCTDSGGPAELVRHEVNGLVTEPTAASVAGAIGRLMDDRALAERLGAAAALTSLQLSWTNTVNCLLG
jgi:glycosyltransferase involved in cell wall biosynthesis